MSFMFALMAIEARAAILGVTKLLRAREAAVTHSPRTRAGLRRLRVAMPLALLASSSFSWLNRP